MSTVALNAFFTYNRSNMPESVTLADVPLPPRALPPAGAMTALYGFRDALEELSRLRKRWESDTVGFATVTLQAEIGKMPYGRVSPEKLSSYRFLYLDRITRPLEDICRQKFDGYAAEMGLEPMDPFRHAGFVCERPDFIGKLHQEPEFNHLDVIVYRIDDPLTGPRQIASLFNKDAIVSIEARGVQTRILLPQAVPARGVQGAEEIVRKTA
ncbi:MAG TPA: hypothetical protein DFI00_10920 [Rhodospirillaceae bacterium]|nr:hypothetical protein [Alphaproteobacteria bacterium]OUT42112.1 MAG: hypothetical protein CBB62_07375 [Micavibrio sp. TMED2]HCI47797.1 hypothetical protein [Rhodospirillaceae bacterium]MAS46276.1 hypothetical protein [Alphaproteobacteria bacterium]MAX95538.1 hypothetical protein [Alphaproteobacteria bacterium]|tara:strand:- start:12104 stop:12739 length:636 start_codon:yes stop_codon:yes gene_type:complete